MVVVVMVEEPMVAERQLQSPLFPAPTQVKIVNAAPGWAPVLSTLHTKLQYFNSPRKQVLSFLHSFRHSRPQQQTVSECPKKHNLSAAAPSG